MLLIGQILQQNFIRWTQAAHIATNVGVIAIDGMQWSTNFGFNDKKPKRHTIDITSAFQPAIAVASRKIKIANNIPPAGSALLDLSDIKTPQ